MIIGLLFDEFLSFYEFGEYSNTKELFVERSVDMYLTSGVINWINEHNIINEYFYELDEELNYTNRYNKNFIDCYNKINEIDVLEFFKFPNLPIIRININNKIAYITTSDRSGSEHWDDEGNIYYELMNIRDNSIINMLENYYIDFNKK